MMVAISFVLFLAAVPFARIQLPEVWAFIPSYQSALLICDVITGSLILVQFAILRTPSLLVLGAGYLFCAFIAIPHSLSYPRVFAPNGLLGSGPQTTAWLYMVWHAGFPLAVIGYARLRDAAPLHHPARAITGAAAVVAAIVVLTTCVTTAGHHLLPAIIVNDRYTPLLPIVVGTIWTLTPAALIVLWRRRPHSALDIWLMVVMWAWMFDVGLSAWLNHARFDLGFYAGRMYGLLAASLILLVLLIETSALYARMARAYAVESEMRDRKLQEMRSELIHVSRLTELGQMASALAHEVNQPLTAVSNYVRAARRMIQGGEAAKADAALARATEQIERAGQVIQRLRQLVKKDPSTHRPEDIHATIEEAAAFALIGRDGREVRLSTAFDRAAPPVLIDKVQIQQVLLNLIRNAVEAMQATARHDLVIRTSLSGGMVEVSVQDSGPGLSPEVRQRLFQPFVTTKPSGMGVGLSICHAIVEAHGGRMHAKDNPSGGTVFCFSVPVFREDGSATGTVTAERGVERSAGP